MLLNDYLQLMARLITLKFGETWEASFKEIILVFLIFVNIIFIIKNRGFFLSVEKYFLENPFVQSQK